MAYSMPIPAPPRTPSPLSEDDVDIVSYARPAEDAPPSGRRISFSPNVLSMPDALHTRDGSSTLPTPTSATSYWSAGSGLSPLSAETPKDEEGFRNPFNYQTTSYTAGQPTPASSNVGQRRGHKYRHSSVSHQIFLEPPPRAPLRLPASLPVPTMREGWKSMSREQRVRVSWCFCHLLVAGYVQWNAEESLSLTALSHLILYDAIGAFLCAGVEVLSNFEVWKRSSIRQPFGSVTRHPALHPIQLTGHWLISLERAEVLVGFAMSILLLFMGFDLLSHNISHSLENVGDHEPHIAHDHELSPISARSMSLISMLAIASTLVSAFMLRNHARIAKAMRLASLQFLPVVLSNPSHLLTLSCSTALLLMPLLSFESYVIVDTILSTAIALLMSVLGYQLVKTLGAILLMSYSGEGSIAEVLRDIETDPSVKTVEEAKFWQVHYGLCMANLKLRVRGTEDSLVRLRERVATIIRNRLGGSEGGSGRETGSGQLWEVSTQLIIEKD